jgi:hypothetical protein
VSHCAPLIKWTARFLTTEITAKEETCFTVEGESTYKLGINGRDGTPSVEVAAPGGYSGELSFNALSSHVWRAANSLHPSSGGPFDFSLGMPLANGDVAKGNAHEQWTVNSSVGSGGAGFSVDAGESVKFGSMSVSVKMVLSLQIKQTLTAPEFAFVRAFVFEQHYYGAVVIVVPPIP